MTARLPDPVLYDVAESLRDRPPVLTRAHVDYLGRSIHALVRIREVAAQLSERERARFGCQRLSKHTARIERQAAAALEEIFRQLADTAPEYEADRPHALAVYFDAHVAMFGTQHPGDRRPLPEGRAAA